MSAVVDPAIIVEAIEQSRRSDPRLLSVYWVCLHRTNRDEFAEDLRRRRGTLAIVPHVLRTVGFVDPDSVMNDVADVLDRVREDIRKLAELVRQQRGLDLLVVSRKELQLVDTSSPIGLPEWFPLGAGQEVQAPLEDLTWTAAVPLSDRAAGLDDLRRLLHEVDEALLHRLQATRQREPRRTQSLWDLVFLVGSAAHGNRPGGVEAELDRIGKTLAEVKNPTGYRPSASRNQTVVGHLWAHTNRTAPDQLPKAAKSLTAALGPVYADDQTSFAAVLQRPSGRIADAGVRWCLGLIATLRIACQMATAAAHADDYPRFPTALLRSTSEDLRRSLDRAVTELRRTSLP